VRKRSKNGRGANGYISKGNTAYLTIERASASVEIAKKSCSRLLDNPNAFDMIRA
jgi:hypothetical protein